MVGYEAVYGSEPFLRSHAYCRLRGFGSWNARKKATRAMIRKAATVTETVQPFQINQNDEEGKNAPSCCPFSGVFNRFGRLHITSEDRS